MPGRRAPRPSRPPSVLEPDLIVEKNLTSAEDEDDTLAQQQLQLDLVAAANTQLPPSTDPSPTASLLAIAATPPSPPPISPLSLATSSHSSELVQQQPRPSTFHALFQYPLLRPYADSKRLLLYDIFFLIYAPLLLRVLVFVYLSGRIIHNLIPLLAGRRWPRIFRQATLLFASAAALFLLLFITSGTSASWYAVIPENIVDNILLRYEGSIDRSCGWAARRMLYRELSPHLTHVQITLAFPSY
ncbi:MAG: hypothetical protein Q9225_007957 [Loekoesia sp. 1 TL-2023]